MLEIGGEIKDDGRRIKIKNKSCSGRSLEASRTCDNVVSEEARSTRLQTHSWHFNCNVSIKSRGNSGNHHTASDDIIHLYSTRLEIFHNAPPPLLNSQFTIGNLQNFLQKLLQIFSAFPITFKNKKTQWCQIQNNKNSFWRAIFGRFYDNASSYGLRLIYFQNYLNILQYYFSVNFSITCFWK